MKSNVTDTTCTYYGSIWRERNSQGWRDLQLLEATEEGCF